MYFSDHCVCKFINPTELTPEGARRAITATRQVWMPYIRKIKLEQ